MENIAVLNERLAYCNAKLIEANKTLIKAYKANIDLRRNEINYIAQKKKQIYSVMLNCAPTGMKFKMHSIMYKRQCKKIELNNQAIEILNRKIGVLEKEIEEVG